jgi:hypothetical protein
METNTKLGTKAGETIADGSTFNISIGQNSGPKTKDVYTKRMWIDIFQTDRPLIGGQFGTPRKVDIWGDLEVHGNIIGGVAATNHSTLTNLAYNVAGHTGFEPTVTKGNLSEATSSVLTITGGTNAVIGAGLTIQVKQATALQSGYLSSVDWSAFNSKQDSLSLGNITAGSTKVTIGGAGTNAVIGTGVTVDVNQANIDHDSLLNFSANEHIDHSGVSILAGVGMSGGGDISSSRTLTCDITQYTDALARASFSCSATGLTYTSATGVLSLTTGYIIPTTTEQSAWHVAATVAALPLTIAGQAITFNYDTNDFGLSGNNLYIKDGGIDHNSLFNYVANQHIDHTTVSLINGNGITGGGDLTASRTLALTTLTSDWDIGDGRMIQADKIRARDGDGLALYEDGGTGIFVEDGGNVGIGTASPTDKIEISFNNSDGSLSGLRLINTSTSTSSSYTGFDVNAQNATVRGGFTVCPESASVLSGGGVIFRTVTNHAMGFVTNNATSTPRIFIKPTGEVGINSKTPSAKLAINGGLHVGGDSDPGDNNLAVDGNVGIGSVSPVGKLEVKDGYLYLTDTDVSQPRYSTFPATAYGGFYPISETNGGLQIVGFSDGDATSLAITGGIGSSDPTNTIPAITIAGTKHLNTNTSQALANDETVLQINNRTVNLISVMGNGNTGFGTVSPLAKVAINGGLNVGADTDPGDNNLYVVGDCSALTFTDRTPVFEGDALKAIAGITSKDGKINHESFPEFMKSVYREPIYEDYEEINENGEVEIKTRSDKYVEKTGRNLGNTISVLLKAIQEQQVMIEELQKKIK